MSFASNSALVTSLSCCLCGKKKLATKAGGLAQSNLDKRDAGGSTATQSSATSTSGQVLGNLSAMQSEGSADDASPAKATVSTSSQLLGSLRAMQNQIVPKVKMLLSHQQVLQGLSGIYSIAWPAAFAGLLDVLQVFAYIDIFKILPGIECAVSTNFIGKLVIRTVTPLMLVGIFLVLGRSLVRRSKVRVGDFLTNFGLLIVFMSYPGVTSAVFRFFQTKTIDLDCTTDGVTHPCVYLVADMSIETSSPTYTGMAWFAWLMILVWPVGVPTLISLLMWVNRAPLLELKRREKILGGGAYNSERWAASLAERKTLEVPIDPRDEEAEPQIKGYLAKFTRQ